MLFLKKKYFQFVWRVAYTCQNFSALGGTATILYRLHTYSLSKKMMMMISQKRYREIQAIEAIQIENESSLTKTYHFFLP